MGRSNLKRILGPHLFEIGFYNLQALQAAAGTGGLNLTVSSRVSNARIYTKQRKTCNMCFCERLAWILYNQCLLIRVTNKLYLTEAALYWLFKCLTSWYHALSQSSCLFHVKLRTYKYTVIDTNLWKTCYAKQTTLDADFKLKFTFPTIIWN